MDATAMGGYLRCYIYRPDGTQGEYLPVPNGDSHSLDVDSLPQSGQYTLRCDPDGGGTGTVKAAISHYVQSGALSAAGASPTLNITRPGQDGIATFTAQAGERVSLAATGARIPSYATVTITGPDGNFVSSITAAPGRNDAWDSGALAAGTYTVRVADRRLDVGKVTLTLDVGVLARGGAAVKATVARPGQNLHASFTAKAGDDLSLEVAANTFTSSLWADVLAPSGTAVVSFRLISAGASGSIALTDLAEAGTYKVRFNPTNAATGSLNLSLKAATAAAQTHAFTSNVPRVSVKSACRVGRLARTFSLSLPDWLKVRADKCDRLEQQAKAKAEKAKKAAGIVPKGRDAWRPAAHNLKGRDWLTGRGAGPKAPAALRAPPGSTAVTGHVLKLDGKPLPKATVRVGAKSTKTDGRGTLSAVRYQRRGHHPGRRRSERELRQAQLRTL